MPEAKAKGFAPPFDAGARGYADVSDLQPHPLNDDLYVYRDNQGIVQDIYDHGFRESQRILVCQDGTILSGHRRWEAAKETDLERVPVEVSDVDPDSDEARLELLTANQHRDKTPGEKINEGLEWENVPNLARESPKVTGRTNELVAERLGIGKESYRKGKYVKEQAAESDLAREQWGQLLNGDESIHGAYTAVKDAETPDEPEPESGSDPEPTADSADEPDVDERDEQVLNGEYEVEGQPEPEPADEPEDAGATEPEPAEPDDPEPATDTADEPPTPDEPEADDHHTPEAVEQYAADQASPDADELAELKDRIAELEEENGKLQALAKNGGASADVLRQQLATCQGRVEELESNGRPVVSAFDDGDVETLKETIESFRAVLDA